VNASEALTMIATGELPCLTCGEVHRYHCSIHGYDHPYLDPNCKMTGTWARDGHPFRPMEPRELARRTLANV
jgi:hypothetical protein